jgi:hypothetical protein
VSVSTPPRPSLATSRILRTMTRRKLLRAVEIAEILGVSKQRADQLRREPDSRRRSADGRLPRRRWTICSLSAKRSDAGDGEGRTRTMRLRLSPFWRGGRARNVPLRERELPRPRVDRGSR